MAINDWEQRQMEGFGKYWMEFRNKKTDRTIDITENDELGGKYIVRIEGIIDDKLYSFDSLTEAHRFAKGYMRTDRIVKKRKTGQEEFAEFLS